ncbi:hypothetical protein BgAZ_101240 [Babesia gibsoni]|uniref:Uncharacterized protein n=1 Tax=Babesia gibsoni TaxID=33632 RepID=A0AAD8PF24_BABGI|nr:hypothetical protein BgAZ_101240 [Babesia gibsoni]
MIGAALCRFVKHLPKFIDRYLSFVADAYVGGNEVGKTFTTISFIILLISVGAIEFKAANSPWATCESAPGGSGNNPTTTKPTAPSSSDVSNNDGSVTFEPSNKHERRYERVAATGFQQYLLAYSVTKVNNPDERYIDMEIISVLVDRNEDANSGFVSNIWSNTYDRMTNNRQKVEDLGAQLQEITSPENKKKLCSGYISNRKFERYIYDIVSLYGKSVTTILDQIAIDGGLNLQRNMLKCLSMSMLNDEGVNKLIEILTSEGVRQMDMRNPLPSKFMFGSTLKQVDKRIAKFAEWIGVIRQVLNVYALRIGLVGTLFSSVAPEGLMLEHYRQSEKCAAQWYKYYRVRKEVEKMIVDLESISANVSYSLSKFVQSPDTIRMYGKAIKIILDSLPYTLDDRKLKDPMSNDIEALNDVIIKLKYAGELHGNVRLNLVDVVKRVTRVTVENDPELILSIAYLLRLFRNMTRMGKYANTWITDIEELETTGGSRATRECDSAISSVKSIAQRINTLTSDAKSVFIDIIRRKYKNIDMGKEPKGIDADSRSEHEMAQLMSMMDQIYMKLYSARLLLMEFYDMIFSMRGVVNIKLRLFQEYDIVDEARTIIKMALTALEEHFGHYTNFKERAMSYLEMHPPMEGSREDVTGSASNSIKQEVRELDSIFNALHSGSPLNDVEEALALFFGMRTMLHKALLLEKSIDVIKHLGSRIVEGMNGHGETGKR